MAIWHAGHLTRRIAAPQIPQLAMLVIDVIDNTANAGTGFEW